jgi:sulfur-oxidizing protein SoxA
MIFGQGTKWAWLAAILFILFSASSPSNEKRQDASRTTLSEVISGYDFLTPQTQALQDDPFENPAMLWVDRGERLFRSTENGSSCANCHSGENNSFALAATRYPQVNAIGEVVNLEGRINLCRVEQQNLSLLPYESDALLALTSYVAHQAKGHPRELAMTEELQAAAARGEAYFFTRRGQMNLSCAQCHNDNWGKKLRGDTISQGQPTGFPTYRFEWDGVGSLHRRLSDCDKGVRAEPHDLVHSNTLI